MRVLFPDGTTTTLTFTKPGRRIEVMKLQYELLSDKFNGQETNASTADLIKSMADGTRTHHASALKFGLREGFSRTEPALVEKRSETPPGLFGTTRQSTKKLTGRFGR